MNMEGDTKEYKRYIASYYNYIAQEQQTLFIKASNRLEATSTALMLMGDRYGIDNIDSLTEYEEEYFYTYEEAFDRFKKFYGKDPALPEAKWDEEEKEWYYKEESDGTRYYY